MPAIKTEVVPTLYCYGELRTCVANPESIGKEINAMVPKVFAGAAKAGIDTLGSAMSIFFTWKVDRETRFTFGPMVAGAPRAQARNASGDGLGVRTALGCKCAVIEHLGPHKELRKTREAMFEWIGANGYESRLPIVHVYENNPEEVEPEKLRTKLYVPIA
ncbi:unnamed protein product [Ascophyllum nodosum]